MFSLCTLSFCAGHVGKAEPFADPPAGSWPASSGGTLGEKKLFPVGQAEEKKRQPGRGRFADYVSARPGWKAVK